MRTKKKCEICSKRFEAGRSDAVYCSNACKQKAHNLRRKSEINAVEQKETFQFSEYESIIAKYGYETEVFTLIFYCFLRRNFPKDAPLPKVIAYIDSVWTLNNYDVLTTSKAYYVFQEEFLNNNVRIV